MRRFTLSQILSVLLLAFAHAPIVFAGSSEILNGSVAVAAVSWVRYPVVVTPAMLHPRIVGRLTASGGTGNDILVAVMNDADFTNWANGHEGSALYNSGQVTVADVKVEIPEAGAYVVLLDNKFSGFTAKTVEGRLRLLWDEAPPPPVAAQSATDGYETKEGGSSRLFWLGVITIALLGAVAGATVMWMVLGQRKTN